MYNSQQGLHRSPRNRSRRSCRVLKQVMMPVFNEAAQEPADHMPGARARTRIAACAAGDVPLTRAQCLLSRMLTDCAVTVGAAVSNTSQGSVPGHERGCWCTTKYERNWHLGNSEVAVCLLRAKLQRVSAAPVCTFVVCRAANHVIHLNTQCSPIMSCSWSLAYLTVLP